MTKKLLLIISILLILIFSVGGVCYADYSTTEYLYNQSNNNVSSKSIVNDNQTSTINQLYTSGYRSVISRYTSQTIHVKYNFEYVRFMFQYGFTNGNSDELINYINSLPIEFVNFSNNALPFTNLNTNNLTTQIWYNSYADNVEVSFLLQGILEFDMPLKNVQLVESNNATQLNFASIGIKCFEPYFTVNNHVYKIINCYMTGANTFNYSVQYTLNNTLKNIDGVYLFNEITLYTSDTTFNNNFSISSTYNVKVNNTNTTLNISGPYSRQSILYNLVNDSELNNISYYVSKNTAWEHYGYTFNSQNDFYITISTFAPLFYNDNEYFIQTNTNGNLTPLKLDYYDAKWYEIHLQLANGLIFIITELPIISNITNVVYNIFNVLQVAFNTMMQFNGFGYIFTFGMFALVFGILIKMFLGD